MWVQEINKLFLFPWAYVKGIRISLRHKTEVMNVKRMWFAVMSSFLVPTFGEVIFYSLFFHLRRLSEYQLGEFA